MTNNFLASIPKDVASFLKRALIIFILWKIIYHAVFFPVGFPNKKLTEITAIGTIKTIKIILPSSVFNYTNIFNSSDKTYASVIFKDNKRLILISDFCNGLELHILYIGFLFCFPSSFKKIIKFSFIGLLSIFILNILRCTGIAYLNIEHIKWVNFAHHYVFKLIIYGLIFFLWVIYTKEFLNERSKT